MLDRAGYRGALSVTGELERALDGADFVLIQIRVGGQAARLRDETIPLAVRLHRPGDDRRRRLRQGAAHGPGGARDRRRGAPARRRPAPGSSTSRTRSGIVTRALLDARPPRGRAVQRGDRLPARRSRGCSASSPARIEVDQVGLNHLTWVRAVRLDGEDVLGSAAGRPRRRARRGRRAAAPAARGARRRAVLLPALLLRPRPRARRAARGRAARARGGRRDRARAARDVPRPDARTRSPRCSSSAAAPSTARPPPARRLAGGRRRRRARGRHAQRRHARRAAPTTTSSRCPRASAPRRPGAAARRRRSRRSCSGSPSTSPPTSGSPCARRCHARARSTSRKALLTHPLIGQDEMAGELVERLLPGSPGGERGGSLLAVDGGNSKTDLALLREDGAVLALVRGGISSPHHLGLDGCARAARASCSADALAAGRARTATAPVAPSGSCCWPAPTCPSRRSGCTRRSSARGWAERLSGRQRHLRGPARRHRARLGRRRGVRRGHQLRRRRAGRAPGALPLARRDHAATGAAATTSASPRCRRPSAARTDAAPRTRARARACPRTSASTRPRELVEAIHLGRAAAAADRRAAAARLRRGARPTPRRPRSSTGWPARCSRSRARRSTGSSSAARAGRGRCSAAACSGPATERLLGAIERRPRGREVERARARASEPIVGAALLALDELRRRARRPRRAGAQ